MNYLLTGDHHITVKTPRIRTDDYVETQLRKWEFIRDTANKEDAAVIIAGDITDRPSLPTWLLNKYIDLFLSVKHGVYVIYGQHDLHFHNRDITRTPLGTLLASGVVGRVEEVKIDGRDFGVEKLPGKYNWLCAHFPVTKGEPPFFMEDAMSARQFLKANPEYDLIITGDWHESHMAEVDGRYLFNPGPIMRPSKDKANFKPRVVLLDTYGGIPYNWKWIDIPIEKDVFNLDLMDTDDRTDFREKIREFASNISATTDKQNFVEILRAVVDEFKPRERTIEIIGEIVEEVYGER